MKALSEARGGDTGENAYIGRNGYDIARLAAGSCLEALTWVLDGRVDNAYALVRPPGHHAERDRGRGSACSPTWRSSPSPAQARGKVDRVAVVDWDVHHGNGTQAAFYSDPTVLTISIHQDGCTRRLRLTRATGRGPGTRIQHQRSVAAGKRPWRLRRDVQAGGGARAAEVSAGRDHGGERPRRLQLRPSGAHDVSQRHLP